MCIAYIAYCLGLVSCYPTIEIRLIQTARLNHKLANFIQFDAEKEIAPPKTFICNRSNAYFSASRTSAARQHIWKSVLQLVQKQITFLRYAARASKKNNVERLSGIIQNEGLSKYKQGRSARSLLRSKQRDFGHQYVKKAAAETEYQLYSKERTFQTSSGQKGAIYVQSSVAFKPSNTLGAWTKAPYLNEHKAYRIHSSSAVQDLKKELPVIETKPPGVNQISVVQKAKQHTDLLDESLLEALSPQVASPHKNRNAVSAGWCMQAGDTLRKTLNQWAAIAHWKVVWEAAYDYQILADGCFSGDFISAAKQLGNGYQEAECPLKFDLYPSQQLAVVSEQ